ncbi:septal ring lytic transglycosylase RlpA family protein [Hansschlegelia quercus]|uniref:septal ring lytic transglycosylase RlpA family protein n=1 Tax=Hansschlegelia quercus TaxID=2528245 RepID=UPI001FE046E1|nr:septal ring lytic transglycosylase RlpA family protein [Hansschlegelia quercus]
MSPDTVADATPPASVETVATAQASSAGPASANGTNKPYSVDGKSYRPAPARKPGKVGVGLASWYGESFQGRRTANGETFDMAGFTAAHPTLPLPCYARVTNVQNGRSMVVRVNDRGPFHKNRLIDVSKRTADMLGFRGTGVGNVKVDYIGPASATRDDRRMLATYQEFGRPAIPAGTQMASLSPVSDAALAAESGQPASVVQTLVATAASAATTAKDSVVAVAKAIPLPSSAPVKVATAAPAHVAPRADPTVASVSLTKPVSLPNAQSPSVESVAALAKREQPHSTVAAPKAPVAVAFAETTPHKRVVQPAAPVLASSTPDLPMRAAPEPVKVAEAPQASAPSVSSRIASSFEAFGTPAPFGRNAGEQAGGLAYSGFR